MVSPPINRSISAPDIALTSNTSSRSSNSSKGISWTKRAGNLILTRKPKSELTEKSLEEFNKRHDCLEEKRYVASSPYYKGLTDFTLDIKKDQLPVVDISDAGSVASSSRSSFVTTIQNLGTFCMFFKQSDDEKGSSSSTSLSSKIHKDVELEKELVQKKEINSSTTRTILLNNKQKPLRERVLSQEYAPPVPQQISLPPTPPPSEATKVTSPQPILYIPPPLRTSPPPQPSEAKQVTSPQPISYLPPTPTTPPQDSSEVQKISVQQQILYLSPTLTSPLEQPSETEKDGVPQLISQQQRYSPQLADGVIEARNKEDAIIKGDIISDGEEEKVTFTWADKYRPKALNYFICNEKTALELQTMANATDCCHFIFEGPRGVGKRTMISAFLRKAFGAEQVKVREESREFHFKGEAVSSISVNLKSSLRHVEVNLSDLKGYEKHVIVDLIKDKSNRKKTNNEMRCKTDECRAIILYEADKLSHDALLYIRWLLERYKGNNKVIFCCNEVSKLQPIKSLCKVVNLLPPSNKEIVEVLKFIAKQEGIELSHQLAENIASNSTNNLRQAIRSFEATWRTNNCNPQLKEDQEIMTGWEEAIAKVARDIVKEQSPRRLFLIRKEMQQLIEHNVSPVFIFKTLVEELKKHLSDSSKLHIDQLYKEFSQIATRVVTNSKKDGDSDDPFAFTHNHRTEEMSKRHNDPNRKKFLQFMRIEEFIAKFMSWYKSLDATSKL